MMRMEIAPYRSSEGFGFTPKRKMMPNAASKSFIMSTKYKNGSKDDAILMGKWLSFHDRKWLTFKRPLTTEDTLTKSLLHSYGFSIFNQLNIFFSIFWK